MIDRLNDYRLIGVVSYYGGASRTYYADTVEEIEWFVHNDGDRVKSWYTEEVKDTNDVDDGS